MQTVILATDRGPGPLSSVASTPMLPVADRPLVAHAADAAVTAGTEELVFVVGDDAPQVQSYFGGRYAGVPATYAIQEDSHERAIRALRGRLDGRVAVLNGSCLYDAGGVDALFDHDAAIAAEPAEGPAPVGTDGGEPTVERASGACVFPADSLDSVTGGRPLSVAALESAASRPAVVDVPRVAVSSAADLVDANARAMASIAPAGETVQIADDATVEQGVTFDGPVLIAGGATVERNATLRGPVVVGPNATVGVRAVVDSAVLFGDATVDAGARLDGAVIGPNCTVGDGASVAGVTDARGNGVAAIVTDGARERLGYW
ncbi:NDP-sugar synthase [Halobacterium sp. R2-5]|uniref:NDP-sugar synthase n=1 Tax=Halobacterium sp. R2-5 TaxID=2715751 RepID=UPI001422BEB2|nr:NDP-sugar synthase [Halobacterium sp. R2-5]NIB98523.1 hypothetical protein [Halobacterium sp. R2-5]